MIALCISKPGASAAETITLPDGAHFAGRGESCRILLPYPEVSERHAILRVAGDSAVIEDLNSSNGTFVDGERIFAATALRPDSIVQIGECLLRAAPAGGGTEERGETPPATPADRPSPEPPPDENPDPLREMRRSVRDQIHGELIARLDPKRLVASGIDQQGLEERVRATLHEIVEEVRSNGRLPHGLDPKEIEDEVFDEAVRLGPIEGLLADDTVSEIMVNGPKKIYVERAGRLELTQCQFSDDQSVMSVVERIVSPIGRRIDESQPYVDARLPDGSRVNAVIPPLSLSGPVVTIRKFSRRTFGADDFVRFGTWTRNAAEFMRAAVIMRKNIVVSGGTGSGKTTLLNLLSGFIPHSERIVTVEDAAELRLEQPHVVRLEARPPNIEGRGAVTIRDLVRNCLRMRPDRIIVGECRGGEALDMLQAMNTGHDGSLTTAHANSPRDALARLENMVMMAGYELPSSAIREQVSSAIDLIVQQSRLADGSRKIVRIVEVTGREGDVIQMQDIFVFNQTGYDSDGRVQGYYSATGNIPYFIDELRQRGVLELDMDVFVPKA